MKRMSSTTFDDEDEESDSDFGFGLCSSSSNEEFPTTVGVGSPKYLTRVSSFTCRPPLLNLNKAA